MPLHVALNHRTTYRYDRPVTMGPQVIRLRPAPYTRTPILSYALRIDPLPHLVNWQGDLLGNVVARVVFADRVTRFDVEVDLIADMAPVNPFDFLLEPGAETWPFGYDPAQEAVLAPFRRPEPAGPRLSALLAAIPRGARPTVDLLLELNRRVQERVSYLVRLEAGVFTPEQTLAEGQGSCRDSAWLLVQVLRDLGFAARFVSGYLIQLKGREAPGPGPGGSNGPEADFADLHAWAEAYLPGAGWIGLDATSGLLTGEGHIPLAAGPEPGWAAPVSGAVERAGVEFDFRMSVIRLGDARP